jgi:hypothetical protein
MLGYVVCFQLNGSKRHPLKVLPPLRQRVARQAGLSSASSAQKYEYSPEQSVQSPREQDYANVVKQWRDLWSKLYIINRQCIRSSLSILFSELKPEDINSAMVKDQGPMALCQFVSLRERIENSPDTAIKEQEDIVRKAIVFFKFYM